jgi:hypothetical protein
LSEENEQPDEEPTFHPVPPPSSGKGEVEKPEDADTVFARASRLKREIDAAYIQLGRDLYMIFHRRLFMKKGYSTFNDWVEGDLGMSKDRGYRVRRLWAKFARDLRLSAAQLTGVGYTRALAIAPVINSGNKDEWVKNAREMAWPDLQQAIADAKAPPKQVKVVEVTGGESAPETPEPEAEDPGPAPVHATPDPKVKIVETAKPRTFNLYDNQAQVVQAALDEACRDKPQEMPPNEALANVATEFMASRLTKCQEPHALPLFYLRMFERVFGGHIMWVRNDRAASVLAAAMNENPELFPENPALVERVEERTEDGNGNDGNPDD